MPILKTCKLAVNLCDICRIITLGHAAQSHPLKKKHKEGVNGGPDVGHDLTESYE